MMTAAYLETVQGFSSQVVSNACDQMRRSKSPFPPSAGELYDACAEIMRHERERIEWEKTKHFVPTLRLPQPKPGTWTDEDLANWSLVINAPGRPYVSRMKGGAYLMIPPEYPGGGNPTFYGYLTPRESKEAARAQRQFPTQARA